MAVTKIHGGMDETITSQLQFTSQMSDYALTNHTHNFTVSGTVSVTDHTHSQYLTTAALSNHLHSQYLTTAAASNHTHSQYANTSHTHNQYSPITHAHTNYINVSEKGNVYFEDGNNVTFGSRVSLQNTTITASINAGTISGTFNTVHTHTDYINVTESGNVYFKNANNIIFGSEGTGASTIITASAVIPAITIGNMVFLNSNGHTFASSLNNGTTYYWINI